MVAFTFAGQYGPEAIIDAKGNAQPGAPIALLLTDGTTLAVCYTDRTKGTVAQNPMSADSLGNVTLFADPGQYNLRVTVGQTVTHLSVEFPIDPGDVNVDVSVETAARIAADAAEAVSRIAGDSTEAAARAAAVTAEATTRANAVNAEAAARAAGDSDVTAAWTAAVVSESQTRILSETAESAARVAADAAHTAATTGVHGVGTSTVESSSGAQTKVDSALASAEAYTDAAAADLRLRDLTTLGTSTLTAGGVQLDYFTPWGLTAGGVAYWDPAGAAAGEEAVLVVATTGAVELVQAGTP